MNGIKYDENKPPLDLLDGDVLKEMAYVMQHGAAKYGIDNWRKGMAVGKVLASVLRHVYSDLAGEKRDPETGRSHLAHALCGLMFALWYRLDETREKPDDRFPQRKDATCEIPNCS
jgi:hypothetical protein